MEKTQKTHRMYLVFNSDSSNEYFARTVVASFISRLDPTVSEMTDVKTAVSEAVTNAIIHGYEEGEGDIFLRCAIEERTLLIELWDEGKGIGDIEKARQPLYTSKPEMERSGMGFTVMETFMDEIVVESSLGLGTKIIMKKTFDKF